MRFDCGMTAAEHSAAKEKWHRFFAVWPRRVGPHDCRWMEWIERKGTLCYGGYDMWWRWEYRTELTKPDERTATETSHGGS